jgi:hypothetical protein
VVRYLDMTKEEPMVVDEFLDLLEVEDGTPETLANKIDEVFEKNKIPWANVVGFSADRCPETAVGKKASIEKILKDRHGDDLVVVPSFCHVIYSCMSNAVTSAWDSGEKTGDVESFLREVAFYWIYSGNYSHELVEFQDMSRGKFWKGLRLSETRWLSRFPVVRKFLKLWDDLKAFFTSELETVADRDDDDCRKAKLRMLLSHYDVSIMSYLWHICRNSRRPWRQ